MKKPLTIKEFLKNNKILISILVAVFVVSLVAFIITFWNTLYDVSAWGSLVSGIFTYLGSSFLGVVVFYNTQSQQRQKEIENQIMVDIVFDTDYDKESGYFIPYNNGSIDKDIFKYVHTRYNNDPEECSSERMCYLYYEVTNRSTNTPVYVEPISIFISEKKKRIDANYYSYYSDLNESEAIDYKQSKRCYIGSKKELLKLEYYKDNAFPNFPKYIVSIKITNLKGEIKYAIFEYNMGKTLGISKPVFDTEEGYKNNVAQNGFPKYSSESITNVVYND